LQVNQAQATRERLATKNKAINKVGISAAAVRKELAGRVKA
jgi:hypothetical protein